MKIIDAEELANRLRKYRQKNYSGDSFSSFIAGVVMTKAIKIVENESTLTLDDLRPKGSWDLDDKRRPYCTNCKKVAIQFENKAYYVPGFCYNCGADMRGGGEDA